MSVTVLTCCAVTLCSTAMGKYYDEFSTPAQPQVGVQDGVRVEALAKWLLFTFGSTLPGAARRVDASLLRCLGAGTGGDCGFAGAACVAACPAKREGCVLTRKRVCRCTKAPISRAWWVSI